MSNRQGNRLSRRGFTLIELLIVISIILIIITFATPKVIQAIKSANETSALVSLKTINSVQIQYQSQFQRFATSLTELGPAQGGARGPSAADLLPGDLCSGTKSGYKFTLSGTETGYVIAAVPSIYGTTGDRSFFTDQTGIVRQNFGREPATAASQEVTVK